MNQKEIDSIRTWTKLQLQQCETDLKELDGLQLNPEQRARLGQQIENRKLELDRLDEIVASYDPAILQKALETEMQNGTVLSKGAKSRIQSIPDKR